MRKPFANPGAKNISLVLILIGVLVFASSIALADKTCHNGLLDNTEGGRDYCIYTDNGNYLPCLNTIGRCGKIISINVEQSEEDSFIPISVAYSNPGTMNLSPVLRADLQVIDGSTVLKSSSVGMGILSNGEQNNFSMLLNTSNVPAGKYDLWVTVISGRKEVMQKFEYDILAKGTIKRVGDFKIESTQASDEGTASIIESYKNTGNNSYVARITTEIYGRVSVPIKMENKSVYVRPGETAQLNFEFTDLSVGEYAAVSSVEGIEQKKASVFSIPMKQLPENETDSEPTGNFLFSAPEIYLALAGAGVFLVMIIAARKMIKGSGSGGKDLS